MTGLTGDSSTRLLVLSAAEGSRRTVKTWRLSGLNYVPVSASSLWKINGSHSINLAITRRKYRSCWLMVTMMLPVALKSAT